jgi:ABC-type sugar transport system substrate-binding protein
MDVRIDDGAAARIAVLLRKNGSAGEAWGRARAPVRVVSKTTNSPFFVELNAGLQQVIEARGDRLVTLDSLFNSLKQRNDISDLLLKGAAGVFINPVNWEGIQGSLLQARDRKVPCLVVDAPVKDEDLMLCQVASDNVEAGRLIARALAKLKPDAKVVILHLSVNKACIDRVAGSKEEAVSYPSMRMLDVQEGKGTIEVRAPGHARSAWTFFRVEHCVSHRRPQCAGLHLGPRISRQAPRGDDWDRLRRIAGLKTSEA